MKKSIKLLVSLLSVLIVTTVFSLAVLADDTGWKKDNGTWYYYDDSGAMAKGWKKIDEMWYYFNQSGEMVTGWQLIDGNWYYFYPSGKMVSDTWYPSGAMALNAWVEGFRVDSSGAAENMKSSNECFDWVLSPGGEWLIYCKKDTLLIGSYLKYYDMIYYF